jgi:hypothetical protein
MEIKALMQIKNIFFAITITALALAIVEVGLHIANYPPTPEIGWRWDQSPYRSTTNAQDQNTNQLGLRGRKIAYDQDDFVVILLGDSQVEAGTSPSDKLPEMILENALAIQLHSKHVKVFSIASAGWGQDQQLIWLRKYFKTYRADLVLAWPTPVNDYWENTFIDRSITQEAGKLKPTFRITADKLDPVLPFRFEWKLQNLFGLAVGRSGGNKKFTLEKYYTDRWLATLPSPANAVASNVRCPALEVLEKDVIESFIAGNRTYTVVTDEDVANGRSHFSPFLKNLSARDLYSVAITHKLLQEIADLSKAKGAQFRIFHPYRSDLDAAFKEIKCVKTQSNGQYFEFDGSDWLRYLKQSSLKSQLISLNISASSPMNAGRNDWHLSYEGNRQVMNVLASTLIKMGLIQPVTQNRLRVSTDETAAA